MATLPLFQALDAWTLPAPPPEPTRFRAPWSKTLEDLSVELDAIDATNPVLSVVADPTAVRKDGMIRADAKVHHRGVILEFTHPGHGQLSYNCARFEGRWFGQVDWQHNARAIVLTLGALRAVERYGAVTGGQQYVGFRAIGAGTPMAAGGPMTVEEAAQFLAAESIESPLSGRSVFTADEVLADDGKRAAAFRIASRRLHPDAGGDPALFRRLTEARDLLVRHREGRA